MQFNNAKKPIVYFGRLAESKGVSIAIKAVYNIKQAFPGTAVPLWIIGGNRVDIEASRNVSEVKEIITELEQANLLFWWGQFPNLHLPYILRRCCMFCFTSKYEPGGRTILEAMASGLPVLATPHGFAGEAIKDGENGFIITTDDPAVWARKILALLNDEELCKRIGGAARQTIAGRYSISHFYKKHWEIYNSFIRE